MNCEATRIVERISQLGDEVLDVDEGSQVSFRFSLRHLPFQIPNCALTAVHICLHGRTHAPRPYIAANPQTSESFDLFSHTNRSLPLGHLAPDRASQTPLDLSIPNLSQPLTITQSPTVLHSSLPTGTTGAVLWRLQPLLAAWLLAPSNPLFAGASPVLAPAPTVLELGSGIGGVLALALALSRRAGKVMCTDQPYVLRGLERNIEANRPAKPAPGETHRASRKARKGGGREPPPPSRVETLALDWETADASSLAEHEGFEAGPDLVLACDCVYNEALTAPFVRACAEVCGIRERWGAEGGRAGEKQAEVDGPRRPTVCVVAQQLRAPDVFEAWMHVFTQRFRVWRVAGDVAGEGMRVEDGYVVHAGILREGS